MFDTQLDYEYDEVTKAMRGRVDREFLKENFLYGEIEDWMHLLKHILELKF